MAGQTRAPPQGWPATWPESSSSRRRWPDCLSGLTRHRTATFPHRTRRITVYISLSDCVAVGRLGITVLASVHIDVRAARLRRRPRTWLSATSSNPVVAAPWILGTEFARRCPDMALIAKAPRPCAPGICGRQFTMLSAGARRKERGQVVEDVLDGDAANAVKVGLHAVGEVGA